MKDESPMAQDELLARYREASAQDTSAPSAHVRENILAHAKNATKSVAVHAVNTSANGQFGLKSTAANDSRWALRAMASVAVLGLCGLLFVQFVVLDRL